MRPNGLEGVMTLKIRYKKKEPRIKRSEYELVGGCCSYGRRNTTIDCVITRVHLVVVEIYVTYYCF